MYVTLFSIILVIGLLLLLLPINIYKKWFDNRVFPIVIRVIGIILCVFHLCRFIRRNCPSTDKVKAHSNGSIKMRLLYYHIKQLPTRHLKCKMLNRQKCLLL